MRIAEIFYSIQGEGALVGVPSVFIRVSGCNLRCTWCDTPYTSWSPEGEEKSIDEIVVEALAFPGITGSGGRNAVITGGEPMLFPATVELTQAMKSQGFHITIETAGTVWQPVACDLMSISPKLANSTPHQREGGRWAERHEQLRYQPEVLKRLMDAYEYQLKFVVASPADLDEIRAMVSELGADPQRVLLMPEGTSPEIVRERGRWIAEICKQEQFRFSPRLHVELWGDKRGV